MKALIPLLLICVSCTKYATFNRDSMGARIDDVHMMVSHLKEQEWLVGKKKEAQVTQSISFLLDMPKVKVGDLEAFSERNGVDAWIVRIIVERGSSKQDLGSLYTPFQNKRTSRGIQHNGPSSSVGIKIYYAAAYASERFRNSLCPALGHNKKIVAMDVAGADEPFSIAIDQMVPYPEKSQLIELHPSSFNAGKSLMGQYFLEIAPYDSVRKTIHAAFKRLPVSVVVNAEEDVALDSCAGEHFERN